MKVKIGNYKNWFGPHQIADKVFFWVEKYPELQEVGAEYYESRWDYRAKEWFGEFLSYGFQKKDPNNKYLDDNRKDSWLSRLCSWIYSKRKRTIKVKIDKWDTWSMDHTLAYIITPMLKQLKETKHGAPYVDDEDVPDNLKSTAATPLTDDEKSWGAVDNNHFARWDYVLDEMIWAFEQHMLDDEPDFWIEQPVGMYFEPCEDNPKLSTMKYDKEGEFDHDAYKVYHDRKANGFRLFGRYYANLWD